MIVGGAVGQVGPYGINDGIKLGGKDVMSDGGADRITISGPRS
jgi:hypothetical protein